MNNTNWYEENSQNQNDINKFQNDDHNALKKQRKSLTWSTMIACMLITALLSGGMGGLIVHFAQTEPPKVTQAAKEHTGDPSLGQQDPDKPSASLLISNSDAIAQDLADVAAKAAPTVVYIETEQQGMNFFGQQEVAQGSGSGVIITSDGYIATNNHVVSGAGKINVILNDGKKYEAELIGADSITDLAVIKINAGELAAAVLGNSSGLSVGDEVLAIGNPLGELASTVTRGIISALDREITVEGQRMSLLQTDAAINPGNSGGGLFNVAGELVGIVNAKSMALEVEGLGFAIPIDTASTVLAELMDNGFVRGRPYLGVNMQDVVVVVENGGADFGLDPFGGQNRENYITRVQIMSVQEESAADKAGIRENDYILRLNDTEIENSSHFTSLINEYAAGDLVTLTVQRGSETEQITVTLGERK